MTRDAGALLKISTGAKVSIISEKGRQYAVYMHHSFPKAGGWGGTYYTPNYGLYKPVVTLRLEKNDYDVWFIEPETLKTLGKLRVTCDGAPVDIRCPAYTLDIAIKITAA